MSDGPITLTPSELSAALETDPPVAVRAVDVEQGLESLRLPSSPSGKPYRRLLALVRREASPVGWISLPVDSAGEVSLADLHFANEASGSRPPSPNGAGPDLLISVVIATCANPARAISCIEGIQAGASGRYEVVVVENRPGSSPLKGELRERFGGDERIRYVEEARPGLSAARNAGLSAARGELVAFTDDDVKVDAAWVPALRRAFASAPQVDCVTGLILPLEFETSAQLLDERFANYGKGFERRPYSMADPPPDEPLFPYAAGHFGSGANMAFRTQALRDLGGFDPVLSTGTRSRGGEDLDVCVRLLHGGGHLVYEPAAIVWHRHPDTYEKVHRQVFDYGAGLGSMLTKHVVSGPYRWEILRRVPKGLRYYVNPASRKNEIRGSDFPPALVRRERLGLLYGPVAYFSSRLEAARWAGRN